MREYQRPVGEVSQGASDHARGRLNRQLTKALGAIDGMDLHALPVTFRAVIPESYLDDMGHMNLMCYAGKFDKADGSSSRGRA